MGWRLRLVVLIDLTLALTAGALRPATAGGDRPREPTPARVRLDLPNIEVLDQDGIPHRFVADLIRGRTVAVSFVFTRCTTVCPLMGATLGRLRQLLGERAGRDLHLVSVSIDPANDTPARLKAWAQRFGGGPGWTLVTGDREEVTRLLKAFGSYSADRNAHVPLLAVGDPQGRWTFVSGLTPPAKLVELLDRTARP
jgi:protein SCO1/2